MECTNDVNMHNTMNGKANNYFSKNKMNTRLIKGSSSGFSLYHLIIQQGIGFFFEKTSQEQISKRKNVRILINKEIRFSRLKKEVGIWFLG